MPIALLLQRLPLIKTLSIFVFIWGVVCILTVVVTSYKGLIVQRVFLGLMEVSFAYQGTVDDAVFRIPWIRHGHFALVHQA